MVSCIYFSVLGALRTACVVALFGVASQAQAFVLLGHNTSYQDGDIASGEFVYKWGDVLSLGSPGGTVTYSFLGPSVRCRDAALLTSILSGGQFCSTSDPLAVFGSDYQSLFSTAFSNWSSVANIDFVQVPDSGADSGRDQPGQAGMIRIGAGFFNTSSVDAFSVIGPTRHDHGLAADIFFNAFTFGGRPWDADYLLDVAMHEIGHSLGLDHSKDNSTVMGPFSQIIHANLTSDDIAGVQTLYGLRQTVPEPGSWLLFLTGLTTLFLRRRTWLGAALLAPGLASAVAVIDPNVSSSNFSGAVSIEYQTRFDTGIVSTFCSGSLVGTHTVLTAAHCAAPGGASGLPIEQVGGTATLVHFNGQATPTTVAVASAVTHPLYTGSETADLQVLKLADAAPSSSRIYAVANDLLAAGQSFFTAVYGATQSAKRVIEGVLDQVSGALWTAVGGDVRDGDSGGGVYVRGFNGELLVAGGVNFTSGADLFGGLLYRDSLAFLNTASDGEIRFASAFDAPPPPDPDPDPPPPPPPDPRVSTTGAQILVVGSTDPACNDAATTQTPCPGVTTRSPAQSAAQDGLVLFRWAYQTKDESPLYDPAGYYIGDELFQLTDDTADVGQFGLFDRFRVKAGDPFGFYVDSVDNALGEGTLGIFNMRFFADPLAPQALPEPATVPLLLAALAALTLRRRNGLR